MAKKEAPEVSFHRGEVHVLYGFLAPQEGPSVTFEENSHCAQNYNNTLWQFLVTNKVRMQQQEGKSSQKLRPRGHLNMGREMWPKGGRHEHNTWKQTENTSSSTHSSSELLQESCPIRRLLSFYFWVSGGKNALGPIFGTKHCWIYMHGKKKNQKNPRGKRATPPTKIWQAKGK